jgi:dynein heavy chain
MRKDREEYRRRLVSFIFKQGEEMPTYSQIPPQEEKDVLRYYYYIHNGIDTVHVPPLEQAWLNNIYSQIPKKLQTYSTLKQHLTEEVKEEFLLSVKKAAVDFVLQELSERNNQIKQYDSVHRQELKELSKTWRSAFERNLAKIQKNLHTVNPCLAKVLDLWYKSFRYALEPFYSYDFLPSNKLKGERIFYILKISANTVSSATSKTSHS